MFNETHQGDLVNLDHVVNFCIMKVPYEDNQGLMGVYASTLQWEIGHAHNGCGQTDYISIYQGTLEQCQTVASNIRDKIDRIAF